VLKKGGVILALVARPDPEELKKYEIRAEGIWVKPNAKDLSEIARLIDAGKIKPIVTQVRPMSEAIAAEQQAETHHTRGKVVLRIADEPKN
jgi:NADPH:quinone reductase-like Zn-dependent oxidoreductase